MEISNSELKTRFTGEEIALAKKREDINEEEAIANNVEAEIKSTDTRQS